MRDGVSHCSPGPLETLLKRDRALVAGALIVAVTVAWAYLLAGAGMSTSAQEMVSLTMAVGMSDAVPMDTAMSAPLGSATAMRPGWTDAYALLMFAMWWVMMIAMMLPSAASVMLIHASVLRRSEGSTSGRSAPWPTAVFALGYLLAWGVFSAIATGAQWSFERSGLLSPMLMHSTSTWLAGAVLLLAGAYQLTPLKRACLRHCRGPLEFLARNWRPGARGALAMGLQHGTYCLGCCWALMTVLFFGGVMNLYWVIGLAVMVLIEKVLPAGPRVGRVIGASLAVWGGVLIASAVV